MPSDPKALMAAFNQRQLGDYALESGLGRDDIDQLLVEAKEFLKVG